MEKNNYWVNFWKNNPILNKSTPHEKVGRTIAGVPIDENKWQDVLQHLENELELLPNDNILDIGAGCGLISIPFSAKAKHVVALDISSTLLANIQNKANVTTIEADAREINFDTDSFDKIIIYFTIQHFTEEEVVKLLVNAYKWLKPGGIIYIGDIPDNICKFDFFSNVERQQAYFNSILNNTPIIGTWFNDTFFTYLSRFIGFSTCQIIQQPKTFINAHYRFDVKLIK